MSGPRAKIERAKRHISEFEAAVSGLIFSSSTNPDVIATENDTETTNLLYKIVQVPCVPDAVSAIAADAIHNLRTSLDLSMSQLIKRRTGNTGSTYYPTGGTRKHFESRCATEIKPRVRQDALKLVMASEAYRGGRGDAAWRVHRLDIEDKHRVVYELGFNLSSLTLAIPITTFEGADQQTSDTFNRMAGEAMDSLFWKPADTMFPLKNGDVLFSGPGEPVNDPKFRLDVTFGEPKIVHAEPALPTLTQLAQGVEAIVESFATIL